MLDSLAELRTFQTVAEEGSLSAAARSLGLTVNAVSRRLAQLEERLGVPLAERTTRRLRLTDDGQRFMAHCRRILAEVDEAEEDLSPAGRGLSGLVRVMVHPGVLEGDFLEQVDRLLEEHPRLSLHLLTRNAPKDLFKEGADLAIWPGEVTMQSVVARRVCSVSWVMVCSPGYKKRYGVPKCPGDLEHHTCLRAMRDRPERIWVLQDDKGKNVEVTPGGRLDCDDTETLRMAIVKGLGIGMRPRGEVLRACAEKRLVHVLPGYTFGPLPIHLVSRPGRLRLARVRAIANLLEEAISALS
jgi:DNA-binding transcriptional LysR family regulator